VSGTLAFEIRVVEDKHRADMAALTKKLQWFAENQELLDRDAGRLKTATAEIHQLKEQVRLFSDVLLGVILFFFFFTFCVIYTKITVFFNNVTASHSICEALKHLVIEHDFVNPSFSLSYDMMFFVCHTFILKLLSS